MDDKQAGLLGALFGLLAVGLGAFGAHGLEGVLAPEEMATYETAVRYQMYHALALLLLSAASGKLPPSVVRGAGWAFTAGVLVFSGSLYLLLFLGLPWLGAVTPVGGVSFMVGWIILGWGFLKGGT
jgi:uncharacterized membrane protein YgdD (TMEM256/DUF423 family)